MLKCQIKIWQLSGLTDPFGWKNITIALWNETRVASVFPTRGSIWISIFQILCSLYLRLKIDPLRLDLDPSRRRQLPGGGPIWISTSQILCSLLIINRCFSSLCASFSCMADRRFQSLVLGRHKSGPRGRSFKFWVAMFQVPRINSFLVKKYHLALWNEPRVALVLPTRALQLTLVYLVSSN